MEPMARLNRSEVVKGGVQPQGAQGLTYLGDHAARLRAKFPDSQIDAGSPQEFFCFRTLEACFPKAVRVDLGKWSMGALSLGGCRGFPDVLARSPFLLAAWHCPYRERPGGTSVALSSQ
jgi:hypothetical protein